VDLCFHEWWHCSIRVQMDTFIVNFDGEYTAEHGVAELHHTNWQQLGMGNLMVDDGHYLRHVRGRCTGAASSWDSDGQLGHLFVLVAVHHRYYLLWLK